MALLKALVLPPAFQFLLIIAGGLLLLRWRRTGIALIGAALVSLYLLSIVPVSKALLLALEVTPPLSETVAAGRHQAIVVLGGGCYPDAPEYGGDTVSAATLERLRYAAELRRRTGLPILVSGGALVQRRVPEAELMQHTLVEDFDAAAEWLETRSRNTAGNAEFSARILREQDTDRVFLVTHAAHMPRAVRAFERAGLAVTPAPTAYLSYKLEQPRVPWFVPTLEALNGSHAALYEYLGLAWYRLRYE
jgi:uncharacterized SAM-binding protein YcdF (DUF218 family)